MICKLIKKIIEMAKQVIGIGTAYNDLSADKGRDALDKCNDNFTELYDDISTIEGNISSLQSSVSTIQTNMAGLVTVRVSIGTWNMDADATKAVAWALPANRTILTINVMIYQDGSTAVVRPLDIWDASGAVQGSFYYDGSNFQLSRTGSGIFDSTSYDGTTDRRGWITVQYGVIEPA